MGDNTQVPVPTAIPLPLEFLGDFCRERGIVCLEVFGSILGAEFGPDSDIDFLFTLRPQITNDVSLMDIVDWEQELSQALGRTVELTERLGVEESRNPHSRTAILESAEVLIDLAQAA